MFSGTWNKIKGKVAKLPIKVYTLGVFLNQSLCQVLRQAVMSKVDRGSALIQIGEELMECLIQRYKCCENTCSCFGTFDHRR